MKKSNGLLVVLLVLLALIAGWFYWFQWRPAQIRTTCVKKIAEFADKENIQESQYDVFFKTCTNRYGLE